MRLSYYKKGFTLTELLVVIAIISVLATGAATVYTSQIQKARDSSRIQSMKALEWALQQVYSDNFEYPSTAEDMKEGSFWKEVSKYMDLLPKDPKSGNPCNIGTNNTWSPCDFYYSVANDDNGIAQGYYNLNSGLENGWNVDRIATNDNGVMRARYEIWTGKNDLTFKNIDTDNFSINSCKNHNLEGVTWVVVKWSCAP